MAIFNAARIGTDEPSAALDVALTHLLRFAQFTELLADKHSRILSPCFFVAYRAGRSDYLGMILTGFFLPGETVTVSVRVTDANYLR